MIRKRFVEGKGLKKLANERVSRTSSLFAVEETEGETKDSRNWWSDGKRDKAKRKKETKRTRLWKIASSRIKFKIFYISRGSS